MSPEIVQPPITVTMIGKGTGDGGTLLPDKTLVVIDGPTRNLVTRLLSASRAILIWVANVAVTTFLSFTGLGSIAEAFAGQQIPAIDAESAFWLALLAAAGEALKSAGTILSGLEKKFPLASGNV